MQDYRAYPIGSNRQIIHRIDLVCADDEAAKERAKQLVDGHDIELWQLGRKIATFSHKPWSYRANLHPSDWFRAHRRGMAEQVREIRECENCHAEMRLLGKLPAAGAFAWDPLKDLLIALFGGSCIKGSQLTDPPPSMSFGPRYFKERHCITKYHRAPPAVIGD
jgi:hypothetical protein